jgi:hypothetical protein
MGPRIKAGSKNSDIVGGLDFMATFASLAGLKLPETIAQVSRSSLTATTCRQSYSAATVSQRARIGSISRRMS